MNRRRHLTLALVTSLAVLAASGAQAAPTRGGRPVLAPAHTGAEPKALELLKAMSARLVAARTLSFQSLATYESPSLIGPPLAYTTLSEVSLQRSPTKLKVVTPGDGPASEFYYDGKTVMAYEPASNLVAIAGASPTLDAALAEAYHAAAIYFPFTDVLLADPYATITEGVRTAFVVGQSKVVGATTTDIVAVVNDKVFAQIWIGADDKLPRQIRAVYLDDPSRLRHQVDFSAWKVDAALPANTFVSVAAASANHIPFASPELKLPEDAAPQKTGPSSKKQ